jgi:hypothetical protein
MSGRVANHPDEGGRLRLRDEWCGEGKQHCRSRRATHRELTHGSPFPAHGERRKVVVVRVQSRREHDPGTGVSVSISSHLRKLGGPDATAELDLTSI